MLRNFQANGHCVANLEVGIVLVRNSKKRLETGMCELEFTSRFAVLARCDNYLSTTF